MVFKNKALRVSSVALATVGLSATAATAQSLNEVEALFGQMDAYESEFSFDQGGAGAAQFSDVSPADWAYQALDDLVRRYDCLKGYPNGTFRGNRALSRYEFAAGLNACMQQIERLIAETTADFVTRDDLDAIQRLMEDFEAELNALGSRVDALESRVSFLEDNSFSTTTKLTGEVIVAATSLIGADNLASGNQGATSGAVVNNTDDEVTFGHRTRLTLNTSFTGEDLLATRLNTGNLTLPGLNTNVGTGLFANSATKENTQTFNDSNANSVVLDWLAYYLPVGDAQVFIAANGGIWDDFVPTNSPYFQDFTNGKGALSQFASENPIYAIGAGAGAGLNYPLGDKFTLSLGYLSNSANSATLGLFSGDYAMLGQISGDITEDISLGFTYVHAYHPSPVGTTNYDLFDLGVGTASANWSAAGKSSNSYGTQFAWDISDDIALNGFFTYTDVIGTSVQTGDAEVWTYGLGLAFPDLGGEGNLLGLFAGAQPYAGIVNSSAGDFYTDETPYHVELFYKYQLNDSISITPGVIWLTAPNQIDNDALIGTIRTTFSF